MVDLPKRIDNTIEIPLTYCSDSSSIPPLKTSEIEAAIHFRMDGNSSGIYNRKSLNNMSLE